MEEKRATRQDVLHILDVANTFDEKHNNKKQGHEKTKELPEPGVDPGSSEPQSDILPLNYSGFHIFN